MPRHTLPTALLLLVAATVQAAPTMGSFSLDLGGGIASVGTGDIEAIYAPYALDNHASYPPVAGGGLLYNVSDAFQAGATVEQVNKKYRVEWPNGDVETWTIPALGILGRLRWLIPLEHSDVLFAVEAAAGTYQLSGATLRANYSAGHAALHDSAFGGLLEVESEYAFSKAVAASLGLGYRFVTFSSIRAEQVPGGTTDDLLNGDGSAASFEYSGPFAAVSLRLYFGGNGTSEHSE